MAEGRRAITQQDYDRAHVTILALKNKAVDGMPNPLFELIGDFYRDMKMPGFAPTDTASAEREVEHAVLVLEALASGGYGSLPASLSSTPGA